MRIELTTNPVQLQLCEAVEFEYRLAEKEFTFAFTFDLMFQEEPNRAFAKDRVTLNGIIPRSVKVTEPRALLAMFEHVYPEPSIERRAVAIWFTSRLTRDLDLKPAIERAIEIKRAELSTARLSVPTKTRIQT